MEGAWGEAAGEAVEDCVGPGEAFGAAAEAGEGSGGGWGAGRKQRVSERWGQRCVPAQPVLSRFLRSCCGAASPGFD